MTTVYIVSIYANITEIGTHSYHCKFTQSKVNKEAHVDVQKSVSIMLQC